MGDRTNAFSALQMAEECYVPRDECLANCKESTAVQRAPDFFLHRICNVLNPVCFPVPFFATFWNRQDILATVILLIHANLCFFPHYTQTKFHDFLDFLPMKLEFLCVLFRNLTCIKFRRHQKR